MSATPNMCEQCAHCLQATIAGRYLPAPTGLAHDANVQIQFDMRFKWIGNPSGELRVCCECGVDVSCVVIGMCGRFLSKAAH